MGPNVLLVVFDAARRDALEPYGATVGSSPTVAQLAGRGRAHAGVYATAPWTLPSHTSMFTGLMPRAAGLARVNSPAEVAGPLGALMPRSLPVVMREAGYETAAASANLWLSKPTGFDAGFDQFSEIDTDRNAQLHLDSRRSKLHWYLEALRAEVDDGAEQIENTVRRWATGKGKQPFFWFLNMLECHSPYLPPRPFGGWSPIARIRAAADARRHYTLAGFWRACAGVDEVADDVLERGRRFYAESIRYMDHRFGLLLEILDAEGLLADTLVIVLSDHGENFGENGLINHGMSLDNRLIHVPFISAGPGAEEIELTSLVDLPREIARACGVEPHPWESQSPPGVAVAQFDPPVMEGEDENLEKLRQIGIDGDALERFVTPLTCAVNGDLKLLRKGTEEVVFDLAQDPGESRPVPLRDAEARHGATLTPLRDALEYGGTPVAGGASTGARPSDEEVRDLEERMKLLGYM